MRKEIKRGFDKAVKKWGKHKKKVLDSIDKVNKVNERIFGKPAKGSDRDLFDVDLGGSSGEGINFDPFASEKKRGKRR